MKKLIYFTLLFFLALLALGVGHQVRLVFFPEDSDVCGYDMNVSPPRPITCGEKSRELLHKQHATYM